MENLKKLFLKYVKCDNQQQYKYFLEVDLVSTPEGITENSRVSIRTSVTLNNHIAIKSLHQFSEVLDVKQKSAVRKFGSDKSNRKSIITGHIMGSSIPKRLGHTKINAHVKISI